MTDEMFSKHLKLGLRSAFDSAKYADLTIRCYESEFLVHKVILCSQSKFFAAACDNDMKEKETNTITLKEDDPDVVRAMLQFLYKFDYHDGRGFADTMEPLSFNVLVYSIADKYDIQELKELAKEKFECLVKEQWVQDAFPEALRAVYGTTPGTDRGLRDIAARIAYDNITELMSADSAFGRVLGDVAALGADLVTLLVTRGGHIQKYKCSSCQGVFGMNGLMNGTKAGYCYVCSDYHRDWKLLALSKESEKHSNPQK